MRRCRKCVLCSIGLFTYANELMIKSFHYDLTRDGLICLDNCFYYVFHKFFYYNGHLIGLTEIKKLKGNKSGNQKQDPEIGE